MFFHIVPCFCFIFHLILRLFSAHPDSHLIFSAVAPCVIRHCCQCCQRSHRCNITVQRISHCFQLTCFDFKQDAAFQQAFFADFLFHLCIFKDVVRLKQARIVHTLETINDRPAHKCYTAGIFPYFKVCINLADLHRKNKFYFIIFPHSLKDQISFFHICSDILLFSIYTYLNRTRTYPGWNMDSQNGFFLCFSGI